jgi:hypothetical protein
MTPTLSIFLHWLLLGTLFAGLGMGLRRLVVGTKRVGRFADVLWAGWALHLVVLMAWHFFWPVRLWPLILLTLLAVPGLSWWFKGRANLKAVLANQFPAFLLAVGCGLWLANYSTGPILCFDTGLYHLSAVRWSADHALVPGLANLHDRLGVQCATHLSAAMLEFGREVGRSHHLVLGLPFWIVAAEAVFGGWRMVQAARERRLVDSTDALALLGLIPLMYQIVDLPSHSSDLPSYLIVWAVAIRLWRLDRPGKEDSQTGYRWTLFLVVFLSAVAITIKPSTLFFSAAAVLIAVVHGVVGGRVSKAFAGRLLVVGGLVGLLWVGRGVILSGYPAYPAKALGVSVDWKVPEPLVEARKFRTMAFTRERTKPWYEVLGNDRWYDDWCRTLPKEFWWLIRIAFFAGLVLALAGPCSRDRCAPRARVVLPAAGISLLGWFLTAPDPRFAGAPLWFLVLGTATLALVRTIDRLGCRPAALAPCALGLLGLLFLTAPGTLVRMPWRLDDKRKAIPIAPIKSASLPNGLTVHVPVSNDVTQLWDAVLPNAPGVHPALEARDPGNLGAGFRIHAGTSAADLLFPGRTAKVSLAVPSGFAASVLAERNSDPAPGPKEGPDSRTAGVAVPSFLLLYAPVAGEVKVALEFARPGSSPRLSLTGTIGGRVETELGRQPSGKHEATLTLKRGLNAFRLSAAKDTGATVDLRLVALTLQARP